jgi:cytochrome c peroxidase
LRVVAADGVVIFTLNWRDARRNPKMRKTSILITVQALICCLAAQASDTGAPQVPEFSEADQGLLATLAPKFLPSPPADRTNRFADNALAAEFGRKLFFDARFSGRLLEGDNDGSPHTLGKKGEAGRVSCAGCHVPQAGFLDSRTLGHSISLAAGWGRRHAPSLDDVGQDKLLMWDGRRDALYNQIFEAIESHVEMNSSRLFAAQQLSRFHRKEYESIFGRLPDFNDPGEYPQIQPEDTGCRPAGPIPKPVCDGVVRGVPGDRGDFDGLPVEKLEAVTHAVVNMGKAIGSYERKLSCGQGRFDAWVNGRNDAMSDAELRGLKLFLGPAKCVQCHSGPYLSDQKFHNVGLVPQTVAVAFRDVADGGAYAGIGAALKDPLNSRGKFSDGYDGRLPEVLGEELKGAYKTPMLRCVSQRLAFMHTGQITDLGAVVEFFNQGGSPLKLIGQNELKPLGLSSSEKAELLLFLKTLDGPGSAQELLRQ